jgi:hypothetical protein
MAKAHDLGQKFYWQKLYYHTENPPLFDTETTQEIEPPFRHGKCVVLRVPASKVAIVIGHWKDERREVDALLTAIGGTVTQENGITDEMMEDY